LIRGFILFACAVWLYNYPLVQAIIYVITEIVVLAILLYGRPFTLWYMFVAQVGNEVLNLCAYIVVLIQATKQYQGKTVNNDFGEFSQLGWALLVLNGILYIFNMVMQYLELAIQVITGITGFLKTKKEAKEAAEKKTLSEEKSKDLGEGVTPEEITATVQEKNKMMKYTIAENEDLSPLSANHTETRNLIEKNEEKDFQVNEQGVPEERFEHHEAGLFIMIPNRNPMTTAKPTETRNLIGTNEDKDFKVNELGIPEERVEHQSNEAEVFIMIPNRSPMSSPMSNAISRFSNMM